MQAYKKKSLPIIRLITRRGAGGLVYPEENFALLSKLFASPGVPIWLGPAKYARYSSTIMLT